MSRPFNIVGYDLKNDLFKCVCAVPDCREEYWVSLALLPYDKLGICNECEKEVHMLEDLSRK